MGSTTLVTFMIDAVPRSHSVQLLGSWDNFQTPYPLEKDKQKGHGHWVGCHTYSNIICDGDPSQILESRNGGLRLGGTYWYYYKLDGDIEYYDPVRPTTNTCPLLPGQTVNILEIPVEQSSSHPELAEDVEIQNMLTLDPNARYVIPVPPKKRKRVEPWAQTLPAADKTQPIIKRMNWPAHLSGRPRTALPSDTRQALREPKPLDMNVFEKIQRPRTSPAALVSLNHVQSREVDQRDDTQLASRHSSAHRRPRARCEGVPASAGMMSRSKSTKSIRIFHENPFAISHLSSSESKLKSHNLLHIFEDEINDDDIVESMDRPVTWNGETVEGEELAFDVHNDNDLRPLSAPSELGPHFPDIVPVQLPAVCPQEQMSRPGRLSAILESEAEEEAYDSMTRTNSINGHQERHFGFQQSPSQPVAGQAHAFEQPVPQRSGSLKSRRLKTSTALSRLTTKRSFEKSPRSATVFEAATSPEQVTLSPMTDSMPSWNSLRSSTSSITTGWMSPTPGAMAFEPTNGTETAIHDLDHEFKDQISLQNQARLGISDTKCILNALDSQETIRPFLASRRTDDSDSYSTPDDKTFAKLQEHVQRAFDRGRFEDRSPSKTTDFLQFLDEKVDTQTVTNNLAHSNPFDDQDDFSDSHDLIMKDLGYLGALIV